MSNQELIKNSNGMALKALVVDDNAMNRLVLDRLLKSIGVETVVVEGGADAIKSVKENEFDFILMDILMPEMDGYEACTKIRDLGFLDLKIFACSAHSFTSDHKNSVENGMDEHLSKPILLDDLKHIISKPIP